MRVGIDLTTWANRRGYGRFTRGLVGALLPRRHHEYVLFLDSPSAERVALPPGGEVVVVPLASAPAEAASASGRRSLADLRALRRRIGAEALDALFFPSVYSYVPVRTDAAVIVGIHDTIAEDHPRLVFPSLAQRGLWALKGWAARRRADWILTVSEHARRAILRRFAPPADRVHVVGEAADPAFRPIPAAELDRELLASFGLSPDEPYLAYLGGLNPHKNLPALAEAMAAARSSHPTLRLAVISDPEDRFTPGARGFSAAIERFGLAEAVAFTGYLEDRDVGHVLAGARALVLPSYAEGFGLPAVEAAACGTPVVATDRSPLPEILAGGGLFVDPGDTGALAAAIGRLAADGELARRLGGIALARAAELSWERSAEQFEALLGKIGSGG